MAASPRAATEEEDPMSAEMGADPPRQAPRTPSRRPRRRRRRFEIGRVLGTGITIWFSGLPAYFTLTAVVFAPYVLLRWWLVSLNVPREFGFVLAFVPPLLENLFSLIASATVIYAVFQRLRGRRVGLGATISYGLQRIPAVIGVAVLLLMIFTAVATPVVLMLLAEALGAVAILAIPTMVVYGILYCGLWVAIPVCVVERPGWRSPCGGAGSSPGAPSPRSSCC